MQQVSAASARAALAHLVLGARDEATRIGDLTLHEHQEEGVARVRTLLATRGGALLADDVGMGKTLVALALARAESRALVLAPAALRETWRAAAASAAVALPFHSFEQLGRGQLPAERADLVVVDEAHHLRSVRTRRFRCATAVCRSARVLLLSATPVQNDLRDLRVLLSLFLGERAHALPAEELPRFVVRRVGRDVAMTRLPAVLEPRWLTPVQDGDCLDLLLALPAPLPPRDGADAGILLTYTLARQWASSRAALRAALYRRLARAQAMEDALGAGRLPTRAELRAWCYVDGAQQLAFPELAVEQLVESAEVLCRQVRQHAAAVRDVIDWLGRTPDPDVARAARLQQLRHEHPGERIVAFSEYADTVAALHRQLAPQGRVAMLTHTGGRLASGPISRAELLARFAPGASHRTPVAERIDLLLTTDVLSEGVSLHDASVLVHLDLAWNPARLEQRVGRLRRLGAVRDRIAVYLFPPPAPAERLLAMERRLRLKLDTAAHAVGLAGTILPGLACPPPLAHQTRPAERIATLLGCWRRAEPVPAECVVAAARAARLAAVVAIERAGTVTLLAISGTRVSSDMDEVTQLLEEADGPDLPVAGSRVAAVERLVHQWMSRLDVTGVVDLTMTRVVRSRRALLQRVDRISRQTARHAQTARAPLVHAARAAATATLSAGAERVLDELARAPMPDDAWLHAVGEFAALHAREARTAPARIRVMLLLAPA